MIHFFVMFSSDPSRSPFVMELSALGVEYRIYAKSILLRYRYRIWLLLIGLPRLAWFALKSAIHSVMIAQPAPQAIVVNSHMECLVVGLIRALSLRRPKPRIVLLGFILTSRSNPLHERLRRAYFRFVFSFVDIVLCHSPQEVARHSQSFARGRATFVYIPYGLHFHGCDLPPDPEAAGAAGYVLSAGRSGRDYRTLCEAFNGLDANLHVVCDSERALAGCRTGPNIEILRRCYDACFAAQLRNARCIVVPLAVDDISAGQMVVIQGMAFGKPLIVTRTSTIGEYLTDGEHALLVASGDPAALRAAIERVLTEPELAARLAHAARARYAERHCMRAFVGNVVRAITRHCAA